MGRTPCCDKNKVKRGPWSPDEDAALVNYLQNHGTGGNWISLPQRAGLKRCGKSCRLRWLNYLRPDIKHGCFTDEEDTMILSLYNTLGSRWSVIASKLAGRTDNDVKNRWNTKLKKKFVAAANDSHQQLQSNYHHFSTSTSVVIDHHHRLSIQFPALNVPNFEEYYKPEFSDNSLTQNPPTTTVLTSSINNQGSLMSNVDSETSSSVLVAAAENNDYHDVLWSGPNYSCGSCCGTSSKIDHGFYGMDFVGGNCGEFTGEFWADHQDQSTGLEDVLFS